MALASHLFALALTGVLVGASPDDASPALNAPGKRILQALRAQRADRSYESRPYVDSVEKDFAPALPLLLEVLASNRLPVSAEGEQVQKLSEPQREILYEGLARLPRVRLVRAADELLEGEVAGVEQHALAICLRSLTGDAQQVGAIAQLAIEGAVRSDAPGAEFPTRLSRAFEEGLLRLFQADPRSLGELAGLRKSIYTPLYPAALRSIGKSRAASACDTLLWIARREPTLRGLAFAQLRLTGPSPDMEVNDALVELMVEHVAQAPLQEKRPAVLAMGELESPAAVASLISLLSEPGGVATDALWSLHKITGMGFPADRERWSFWFREETRWRDQQSARVVDDLHGRNAAKAVVAVRALASHLLYRHANAVELARALEHSPEARKPMICAALQMLASERALPQLVSALSSQDKRVQEAARAALATISSLDRGLDPVAWREALSERYAGIVSW